MMIIVSKKVMDDEKNPLTMNDKALIYMISINSSIII